MLPVLQYEVLSMGNGTLVVHPQLSQLVVEEFTLRLIHVARGIN